MIAIRSAAIYFVVAWLLCEPAFATDTVAFVYQDSTSLPEVTIDSEAAKIHSQGLFVTDKHFLVTGRLEKRPKRALLIRFPRDGSDQVEYLDITRSVSGESLDHPGGFDIDEKGLFQIPVSTSHRKGPTIILGFRIDPDQPLKNAKVETTVPLDDHVGAICCVGPRMLGANWDTLQVHVIEGGKLTSSIKQQETLVDGNPMVAVQDWKSMRDPNDDSIQRVILGGIVKSQKPRAAIQILDVGTLPESYGKVVDTHRFEMREGISRPITNEGLAVHRDSLYLLPEDIGAGAKILRYKIEKPAN